MLAYEKICTCTYKYIYMYTCVYILYRSLQIWLFLKMESFSEII